MRTSLLAAQNSKQKARVPPSGALKVGQETLAISERIIAGLRSREKLHIDRRRATGRPGVDEAAIHRPVRLLVKWQWRTRLHARLSR